MPAPATCVIAFYSDHALCPKPAESAGAGRGA